MSATISVVTAGRLEPHHRRTVLRVILVTQLCLAVLTAVVVVIACLRIDQGIESGEPIKHSVKKHDKIGGDPLNILVMGSDSRVGEGNHVDNQTDIGRRSDTTILLHISADRKEVYGVSLPRDALVTRPACKDGDGKLAPGAELQLFNTAFSVGGETCTAAMMEKLTGIYIDHYVSMDFNGFKEMVDAVHGVSVCIPEDVNDEEHGIFLEAGTRELTGQDALNYVRERSELSANADIGRMKRQQAFIASMINKVVSAGTLARPDRLLRFLDAATKSLAAVSPGLNNLTRLGKLGLSLQHVGLDNVQFLTVPWEYDQRPEYRGRVVWKPEAKRVWRKIAKDKPLTRGLASDTINAGQPPGMTPAPSPSPSESSSESASPSEPESSPTPSRSPSPVVTPTPNAEEVAQARANGLCA